MNKKFIRLTESDLHRIVKESVERILRESTNEAKLGGHSFHNDPESWATAYGLRSANAVAGEELEGNRFFKGSDAPYLKTMNDRKQGSKDLQNVIDTLPPNGGADSFGNIMDKGKENAKKVIRNVNKNKMNRQYGKWR